jgi:polyisoprenoid-binding protein YceI
VSTTSSSLAVSRDLGLRTGLWRPDVTHSAVLFSIRHLGLARVRGRFDRFEATLAVGETIAETRVEATIDLASINTNNGDRDAHLRSTDFFSVEDHPEMRFVSTGIEGADEEWTLLGELTLNGRTRPVALDVEFNGVQEFPAANRLHAGFTATGSIRRSEFGIEFGMMKIGADKLALGDEVKIELDFEFVQPEEGE